jgi:hypothetical protein
MEEKIKNLVAEDKTWHFAGVDYSALYLVTVLCFLGVFVLWLQFHSIDVVLSGWAVAVGLLWRQILVKWRSARSDAQFKAAPKLDDAACKKQQLANSVSAVKFLSFSLSLNFGFLTSKFIDSIYESLFFSAGCLAHICITPRVIPTPRFAC